MKQEFDNNFNSNNSSDWSNPYGNLTKESNSVNNTTQTQHGNAYGNTAIPNQSGNAYGNNTMPSNQYGNAYGNNTIPNNQYGNVYGSNAMPNQCYNNGMPNQYNAGQFKTPKKKSTKMIVLIVVLAVLLPLIAVIGFIGIVLGVVFGVLNEVKETEEYELAYSYVVNSNTFERLDVDESEIKFRGYETSLRAGSTHGTKSEFRFDVDGCQLTVVCHQDAEDEWYVCDGCTMFE